MFRQHLIIVLALLVTLISTIVTQQNLSMVNKAHAQFDPRGQIPETVPDKPGAFEHKAVLSLTIITPEGQPDKNHAFPVSSIEECWKTAQAWVQAADIGKHDKDSIGLAAGCGLVKQPTQKN